MGKNPNANRNKKKQHVEKEFGTNLDDLESEAARLGCQVWEVEDVKKRLEKGSDASSSEEENSDEDSGEDVVSKPKTKPPKVVEESKNESDSEEESDKCSADDELDKLYGKNTNAIADSSEEESSEEDAKPKRGKGPPGKRVAAVTKKPTPAESKPKI